MSSTATALVPAGSQGSQRSQLVSAPSTSSAQTTPQKVARNAPQQPREHVVPSPGRFQHPRMAEIVKRRAATSFTEKNVQTIVLNVVALIATLVTSGYTLNILAIATSKTSLDQISVDPSLILNGIRLILLLNIFLALRPVLPYVNKPDAIEDIPLTPSQRALVGLPPSNKTASQSPAQSPSYITPSRYRHSSPSPLGSIPQPDNTPIPQVGSGTSSRRVSGSPFSPSSPLLQKALVASTSQNNLLSSQADLAASTRSFLATSTTNSGYQGGHLRRFSQNTRERVRQSAEPGTPSPKNTRERAKVNMQAGLNYKWIYEKGLKVKEDGGVEY